MGNRTDYTTRKEPGKYMHRQNESNLPFRGGLQLPEQVHIRQTNDE